MLGAIIAAAFVVPVHGAIPAPEDPEFWTVHYRIPRAKCMIQTRLRTADMDKARRALRDRAGSDPEAVGHDEIFDWMEDESRAHETKDILLAIGESEFYDERCADDIDALRDHLALKRSILSRERDIVALLKPAMQALPGLVNDELLTLDRLSGLADTGRNLRHWRVLIAPEGDASPQHPPQIGTDRSKFPTYTMNRSPWRRESASVCTYTAALAVAIRTDTLERSKAELLRRGSVYVPDGCDFQRGLPFDRVDAAIWTDETLLQDIRSFWTKSGRALFWKEIAPEHGPPAGLADDEKARIISDDLLRGRDALIEAPGVRRLAEAELVRLEPFAANAAQAKHRKLVYLSANPSSRPH